MENISCVSTEEQIVIWNPAFVDLTIDQKLILKYVLTQIRPRILGSE